MRKKKFTVYFKGKAIVESESKKGAETQFLDEFPFDVSIQQIRKTK